MAPACGRSQVASATAAGRDAVLADESFVVSTRTWCQRDGEHLGTGEGSTMTSESAAILVMFSFIAGVAGTMLAGAAFGSCDEQHDALHTKVELSLKDAGSDSRSLSGWNEIVAPGIACLDRETKAAQERTYKLQEQEVMLQTQIDVISGAYSLREQLRKEGPGRAQRIANEVVLDAGTPERLAVALKYLKDKTLEFQRTYDGGY